MAPAAVLDRFPELRPRSAPTKRCSRRIGAHRPEQVLRIERWLEGQTRFAHLSRPENTHVVTEIQASVNREWEALLARCASAPGVEPRARKEVLS